jgi:Carboxypeptidase regulatory-like domain
MPGRDFELRRERHRTTGCRIARYVESSPLIAALLLLMAAIPSLAWGQLGGSGTIEGTVTDSSGAMVVDANVTARNLATGVETVRSTTKDGLYTLAPLDAGSYTVTVTAPGFEKLVRENIHVDGLQVLALDLTLKVGSASQTVIVTSAPPQLETDNATLGGTLENEVYQSLPLEMGGANGISTDQRRVTDSALLMPGVTNDETKNNESDEPMVVDGNASSTEMYIEGVPFESASVSGDPRDIWSAFSVDTIDQFQVKTTGYSAEYQGLGVENFTVKSGTNHIHGSLYDVIRNTALDSAGFIPAQYPSNYPIASLAGTYYKPPEHMNEYGASLGGPIWRDKIFLFANYMGFRFSALTKPQAQTIPTAAEMCGDFSAFPNPIYDPTTQALSGGSYSRTQFSGPSYTSAGCGTGPTELNVIPQNEISPIAQNLQKGWQAADIHYLNDNLTDNYMGSYNYGLNNWSTTYRLDVDPSDVDKLSLIIAAGRQGLVGAAGSQTTDVGPLPYLYAKNYAPVTRVLIFQDTYVISSSLVNQFKYGAGQYHSPDNNPTYGITSFAATASGITSLPSGQAAGSFPDVKFSGTDDPAQWGPQTGYVGNTDTYTLLDNVQWLHGKHAFTFGGQYEWLSYNYLYADGGTTPITLNFGVNETAQVSGPSASVQSGTGLAYASYLIGAVDSGSYTQYAPIAQETGSRYHPFAFYANDDYKLSNKLTVNAGLRWDQIPPMHESENRFSFLNPTATNPVTGSLGTLEFAGSGADSCNCSTPMNTYHKNWGPRLGVAYAFDNKTIFRAAYGIYYAHGGGTSGGATALPSTNMELGFASAPNPVSPGDALPAFYLNNSAYFTSGTNGSVANTAFGSSTVAPPPVYNASYATYYSTAAVSPYKISTTLSYLDPVYGGRTPTFEGWSVGFQRQLTNDVTATVSYVGNQGHFLLPTGTARGYYNNQLDPKYLFLGSAALGATATAANMPTGSLPYTTFNNKVSQALLAFPQYTGVTDQVGSVGNSNYNALQLSIVQRLSRGINFTLNYTYSKTIDDIGTFRTGYAIPAGALANSSQAWPMDRIERSRSTIDQPQNLIFTSTYDLPFGEGHIGNGNAFVRALAGGWRLSDIFSYYSGNPLAITEGSCTAPGQGTCMPTYAQGFTGTARQNGGWGHGATRATLSSTQYINPAAFTATSAIANTSCTASGTACNGMLLGNLARTAPYGLRGPGNNNIDASLRRTFNLWKNENVKFIFEASVFNAVNHVWFGSAASTADGSIGTTTESSSLGVVAGQANNPRQWQFAGHINF